MISNRLARLWIVFAVAIGSGGVSSAALIPMPPHGHGPSPVVTFDDGHVPIPIHQHQHRTGHDPRAGVHIHGGVAAYNTGPPDTAPHVWVGRELVATGGAGHPPADEFAHGHQGHELPAGRYHVHLAVANEGPGLPAPAGTGITAAEAAAWNAMAAADVSTAVAKWLAIGNAFGPRNWPGAEGPGNGGDPAGGGLPAPGAGVPWHSSVDWGAVLDPPVGPTEPHEVHIVYGEAGAGAAAITQLAAFGHAAAGAGAVTLTMDDDIDWFYGSFVGPPAPHQTDFLTVNLHEWGHVLGLGHFGTAAAGYIMTEDPQPLFDGHLSDHRDAAGRLPGDPLYAGPAVFPGVTIHAIDPDAIHGIRDLYAIAEPIPEPSSIVLLSIGAICSRLYASRRRSRRAAPPAATT